MGVVSGMIEEFYNLEESVKYVHGIALKKQNDVLTGITLIARCITMASSQISGNPSQQSMSIGIKVVEAVLKTFTACIDGDDSPYNATRMGFIIKQD